MSFYAIFCPFSQLTTQKIKILKLKKTSGDIITLHIFTVNGNYRYDVWFLRYGAKQTISCHSGPFFALLHPMHPENQIFGKMNDACEDIVIVQMCTINESHDVWFLRYEMQQTEFLVILDHFLPFYPRPHNNPKNQNFEKLKKRPGGIIILHTCTINDNHMMYSSWDMKYDRQNFLSLWTVFLPFYYPNNPKNQNFEKKWNKSLQILSFYTCTINGNHITYCSWDMKHDGQNFLSFWTVFCHFTSVNPKNQNFEKLKKRPEDIIILHMHAAINENQMYCSWNVEHDRLFCHFGPFFALLSHPTPKI